jgi:hypothetical protein
MHETHDSVHSMENRSLQDQYTFWTDYFALLIIVSQKLFDSHVNLLPAGLLVGAQLYSKEKTPEGVFSKNICCDPTENRTPISRMKTWRPNH